MASFNGLHHIGIMTADAEKSLSFYTTLLGFVKTAEFRKDASHLIFIENGSCVIELIEKPGLEPRGAGQVDHVALKVTGIEEITEVLKKNNISFVSEQVGYADWIYNGVKNVFFHGPDGERIELFELT